MRTLWSLEIRFGGNWVYLDAYKTLKEARSQRDSGWPEFTTRIRKWVRP